MPARLAAQTAQNLKIKEELERAKFEADRERREKEALLEQLEAMKQKLRLQQEGAAVPVALVHQRVGGEVLVRVAAALEHLDGEGADDADDARLERSGGWKCGQKV